MSTSHHTPAGDDQRKLFDKFFKQSEGKMPREYPAGRLGAHDEGQLAFAVAADPRTGTVVVDFGKPVRSIGLKPADVMGLVKLLMQKAREVSTEPLVLEVS
ncbi:hypothetical protein [Fimbriiglobus ruber]|uniref:Uncharacterized protein n=1 Tax=Fimbriiglobus ruber TaxID=1908690 RepID=A0A225DAP2_9BACT|nr:hypothetical protein [Fimbriiglobus ruber]OWK34366.1 hypothetical protein FRUB_10337 [Fimbriiglobus ruber]